MLYDRPLIPEIEKNLNINPKFTRTEANTEENTSDTKLRRYHFQKIKLNFISHSFELNS